MVKYQLGNETKPDRFFKPVRFETIQQTKPDRFFKPVRFVNYIFLFTLLVSNSFAANIKVFTDRNPVRLDESFTLVFDVGNTVMGPDFSPLRSDFDILNQSQNSQVNIINGQQHSSKQWRLTVMAKRTGQLVIPSISFGQERSTPSIITVQPAQISQSGQAQADLFLEVEVDSKNPYVQSQIIYTVRLFYAINLNNASLSEPQLKGAEGVVEKLGEDVQYETRRDGKRFAVLERKYAIFPQQSGDVIIEPLKLEAKIVEGGRSRFDFFGQSNTRTKRLRSEDISLTVIPIPKIFQGKHWLPAKQLNLKENWSENPLQFKTGEAVTRTLTLLVGGLTAGQLPDLKSFIRPHISQDSLSQKGNVKENVGDLKQYPDQAKLDEQKTAQGIISRREEKVAMMPSQAGDYILPAIEIPWWNTKTERMEMASLPARTIQILVADNAPQTISPVATLPISIGNESDFPLKTPLQPVMKNNWFWLNIFLAIGWLGTIIAWWLTRRRFRNSNTPAKPNTLNKKAALKQLKQACYKNDFKQVKNALLTWAKIHWQNIPNNLGEISQRCGEPLETEIQKLNRHLYSRSTEDWQGIGLWKAFKVYHGRGISEKRFMDELELEPLYQTVS